MNLDRIVRPEVLAYAPYRPARIPEGVTILNANESCQPIVETASLNRYPENRPTALVKRLAALYGVGADNVLVTRGSSEAIDLLIRACCVPGADNVVTTTPTFDLYAAYSALQGAEVRTVTLDANNAFALDVKALLAQCDSQTKLVFLASPNNPTGTVIDRSAIEQILEQQRSSSLVVIDEAYVEFSDEASLTTAIEQYPNLVVLRTLSKAFATAGARCGAAVADAAVIDILDRLLPPYALATPVVDCALAVTEDTAQDKARDLAQGVAARREQLAEVLRDLTFVEKVWPSEANFVLFQVADAAELHRYLLDDQLLVRNFAPGSALANCLRITIGDDNEQAQLMNSLKTYEETLGGQ